MVWLALTLECPGAFQVQGVCSCEPLLVFLPRTKDTKANQKTWVLSLFSFFFIPLCAGHAYMYVSTYVCICLWRLGVLLSCGPPGADQCLVF